MVFRVISSRLFPFVLLAGLIAVRSSARSQQQATGEPPYKDPSQPVERRVGDLLKRMTLEEKFWQLFMISGDLGGDIEKYRNGIFGIEIGASGLDGGATGQMLRYAAADTAGGTATKVNAVQRYFLEKTRLGIPIIPFDEALHGLAQRGATAFPQSIGLAATFDTSLMHSVSRAIARECRSRGIRQVLSPVVNIAGDVRWGRVEETYGEDPFLSSAMGVAFVSEFEKLGVITTPKHFVANVGDGGRDSYPIHFNERLLREIYLPPFKACLLRGGSRSVMTSYNSLDGTPATASDWLNTRLLKGEWKFGGFVISDACAVGGANALHMTARDYTGATEEALIGGLDVIFQTSYDHYPLFMPAFQEGRIPQSVIDGAVARVLRAKFDLGLFENPFVDPPEAARVNGSGEHRRLALEAARKSIVLLKNEQGLLPLKKSSGTIAVIGRDATEARLGGYSGPGNNRVSILEGIRKKAGGRVLYARGVERLPADCRTVPAEFLTSREGGLAQHGLIGEYFDNVTLSGKPVFTRVDPQVAFQWTLYGPDPGKLDYDFYSVRWRGKLKGPVTGVCRVGIDGNDGYRLYIGGRLLIDNWQKVSRRTILADFPFEKGREYEIRIEYFEPTGNAHFRLVWDAGVKNEDERRIREAVTLARECDVALVVAGIEEGEFRDRASLSLPGRQEELIRGVAATGRPVVVVVVGGSAVTMSRWLGSVPAIVDVWYPGEAGGEAVADVIFGDENPAGRLPVTFPVSEGQLPLVYNHKPTGRGDDYLDLTGQPLFPFGHGLSYTRFDYGALTFDRDSIGAGETTNVRFTLTNSGPVEGDEVVQLYIRDLLASVARPVQELKAFRRVHVRPGESTEVSFAIGPETLSMLDRHLREVVEPGGFRIMIGASSKDIRLSGTLTVK